MLPDNLKIFQLLVFFQDLSSLEQIETCRNYEAFG